MASHDAFATSTPSPWCSLVNMDLGEISDGAFLPYLHFCTKQTPSTSNPTQHNLVHKQSSTQTNSPNAQSSIQTSTPAIVQINNDPVTANGTKRTESEISIAVSGSNIVAGYNDNQDSNTATYAGYSYSNDGGKTWTDGGGILPNPGDFNANDPSVVADSQGNFYRSMDVENATHSKWGVAKSTDGGKTFGNPVIVDSVNASTPAFLDKGYMSVGLNPTNPSQDIIHVTYTKFTKSAAEVIYKRSLDGGLTWQDSCIINPGGDSIGAMPIVDHTGNTVYVFYQDFVSSKIVGWKNTNAGAGCNWIRLTDVGVVHPLIAHKVCGGTFAVWNGNHRATEIPVEAIGPNGNLYVTWNDSPDGGNTTQIVLYRSQDGGATWIGPQTFSATPGRDQFEPWIAVAPNGKITIIFYDRVNDPNNLKMDLYAASSTDNGTTWQSNQRITPSSFSWGTLDPPSDPFFFSCYFIGDYQSITYDSNNVAHVAWSDGSVIASDGTPKPNVFYTQLIPTSVPSAPQNLQASSGNAQVSLSWIAPSSNGSSAITGYNIYRGTVSGGEGTTSIGTVSASTLSYNDTGLTNGQTYFYKVTAVNSVGISPSSNEANATTFLAQVSITVKSVDMSGNPITGMSTVIRYTNGTTISESFTPVTFTVTSETTYVVHVRNYGSIIFNHWQDGTTSSYYTLTPAQNVTLIAYYNTAPQPPTGLTATPVSSSQINLSWTAPANNGGSAITGYKIERSTDGGTTWNTLASNTGSASTTYSDTGLTASTAYTYRVSAINSVGTSSPSSTASATTFVATTAPQPPTSLTANAVSSSQINLSWTAPANNGGSAITGYKIERSIDNGTSWSTAQSNTGSTGTTYSDTGLAASTTYTYRVSAINSVGTSSPSNTVSATTFNTIPTPPIGLKATAQILQINLSWNAPSDNGGTPITGYKIERSTNNGSTWSTLVSNTGSTGTTYSDTNVLPLTTYTYRVSAINNIGVGNPSNTASASI